MKKFNINLDRVKLDALMNQRQMLKSFRLTESAQGGRTSMDSIFIQVSRDEHELLIDLAIEALVSRVAAMQA